MNRTIIVFHLFIALMSTNAISCLLRDTSEVLQRDPKHNTTTGLGGRKQHGLNEGTRTHLIQSMNTGECDRMRMGRTK